MISTAQRLDALVAQHDALAPWVGEFHRDALVGLLAQQLGSPAALDDWQSRGDTRGRAFPRTPLLHIVSGNTPHAAFQSVFRGLLVGAHNRVKLPSAGLPEFERWVDGLPGELAELIEVRHDLPDVWLDSAAAVIFGNASTIETFRHLLPPEMPRIEHGPKLSIAVIFEIDEMAAQLVATDVLAHEQRGCLSVQAIYVDGGESAAIEFAGKLAIALADLRRHSPRMEPLTLSDSGAIANARELARFREANGDALRLWESAGDTSWTIVFDANPTLSPGPLNGFVTVHPLPATDRLHDALGREIAHLSTAAIHPFDDSFADRLEPLMIPRVCPLGHSQQPPLFWHHDGRLPLADLVFWRDRA